MCLNSLSHQCPVFEECCCVCLLPVLSKRPTPLVDNSPDYYTLITVSPLGLVSLKLLSFDNVSHFSAEEAGPFAKQTTFSPPPCSCRMQTREIRTKKAGETRKEKVRKLSVPLRPKKALLNSPLHSLIVKKKKKDAIVLFRRARLVPVQLSFDTKAFRISVRMTLKNC